MTRALKGTLLLAVLVAVAPTRAAEPSDRLRWMERVVLGEEVLGDGDPGAITAAAALDLDARGWPASLLRRAAEPGAAPLPFSDFHQVHGLFAVDDEVFTIRGEKTRPVVWHGEGEHLGLLVPVGDRVLVQAPFWLPGEWVDAVRRPGIPLGPLRPLELRQVITFILPPGMPRLELPAPAEGKGGPLEWSLAWTREEQGLRHLEARLEVVLEGGEPGSDEVQALRQELRLLLRELSRGALYDQVGAPVRVSSSALPGDSRGSSNVSFGVVAKTASR